MAYVNPEIERMKAQMAQFSKGFFPFLGIVVLIVGVFSCFYTVEPDEEAVVIRLGQYVNTNQPGLHFKVPFGVDRVIKVKTKQILQQEFGFRSTNTDERRTKYSQENFDSESLMLTGDLNVADVEWAVQYQISDPFKYLFQMSEPLRNVRDVSESIMRRVVGDRLVSEVLTTGRAEIATEAKILMQEVLNHYDMGVRVLSVKLQDVNPPIKVKPSFNEVNAAKQEQEKMINQAEEAYNRVIPQARGEAEKTISESEGYAQSTINRALGDAEKFQAIYEEYRRAPEITRKRLYLESMEKLFSRFKDVTIVDDKVKGLLPVYQSLSGETGVKK